MTNLRPMCHQTHTNLVVIIVSLMQELTNTSDNISPEVRLLKFLSYV